MLRLGLKHMILGVRGYNSAYKCLGTLYLIYITRTPINGAPSLTLRSFIVYIKCHDLG